MSMPKVAASVGDPMAPESVTRLRVLVVDDEKRMTDLAATRAGCGGL